LTPDGIIATDPIDKDAAAWLKTELKKRFNKPVKYLIYSHDHHDHIAGGEVLADGAIVIAHEKAKATNIGEKQPTAVPNITFSDRMTVELGGKRVELIYVGLSHSDNLIAMHFPAERAVFAVDFISVKRLPYKDLSDSYFPDWMEAVKVVEAIDFDILIPGHGTIGTKSDAVEHREYLQSLYNTVLKAAREGRTLEEMKQTIKLDQYRHFDQYENYLPLNIEGVYKSVSLHRRGN
jgi:glyoxylase-like metal-dependent hydrolase (beta-lactamase superfamily II)